MLLSAAAGCSESSLVAAGCSMAQRENYLLETAGPSCGVYKKAKKPSVLQYASFVFGARVGGLAL